MGTFGDKVGDMDVIRRCLDGMGAHARENGTRGLGRHATTIRIGRERWQSPALPVNDDQQIEEELFHNIPALELLKKASHPARGVSGHSMVAGPDLSDQHHGCFHH